MGALGALVLAIIVRLVASDTMSVHVSQPNAEIYHRQDMRRGEFDYGYHVNTVSDQFQHKVKGPDDVTYGCYGYIDPSNRKHLVYYVADRLGYRIIFPNRPTKIFTAKLTDSLNKLDGSLKGKDYDEKVVEWNNLYLPESCFRLDEIIVSAASNQAPAQKVAPQQPSSVPAQVQPSARPVQPIARPVQPIVVPVQPPRPVLPNPTQYTIPPTPPSVGPSFSKVVDYDEDPQYQYRGEQSTDIPQQRQPVRTSLPDINPANINLDQFNGHVYPIYPVFQEGQHINTETPNGQFVTFQHGLNITQFLAQIQAVNSQVITFNMLLAGLANNPAVFSQSNEGSCRSVVQLLQTQKRSPHIMFVPIMIPYAQGPDNVNQPIKPDRFTSYRSAP